jgi:predicted nuclease of predicted toxin-antitoxin system
MKFLLDAQLPPSLKKLFTDNGYDCIHTLDLESGNDTTDKMINQISVTEKRIVITKDSVFSTVLLLKKSHTN